MDSSVDGNVNYTELVRKAQLGGEADLNRLAELAQGRLCIFVLRLGLQHDVAEDILQESLLEMAKLLCKYKKG